MSLAIVVDMNLTARWAALFTQQGWRAVHWSAVGAGNATDADIMAWALANGHAVFTHDLDFTAILARTGASGPSLI